MEYFQDIDWQQLKDEEGRSIDDLLKDEHFEVEIFNDNVYTYRLWWCCQSRKEVHKRHAVIH